jgi:hypothetical protein
MFPLFSGDLFIGYIGFWRERIDAEDVDESDQDFPDATLQIRDPCREYRDVLETEY